MLQSKNLIAEARYLDNFIEMLAAERSVAINTLSAYRVDIYSLLSYLTKIETSVSSVDKMCLERHISKISSEENLSGKTIARKISAMRQFFHFLVLEGICSRNEALDLKLPKRSKDLPKALSQNSVDKLLEIAYSDNSNEGIRTSAMLELLYATGMRISELLSLKTESLANSPDSNEKVHYVIITGKGGKERVVLLNPKAISILNKYLEIRKSFIRGHRETNWLFPSVTKQGKISSFTRQRFGQILKDLAITGGLDHKLVSPHKIRHSFATHLLQNGANLRVVQELLGHSDISSTQIYTKVTTNQAEKLVLEKHPLNRRELEKKK